MNLKGRNFLKLMDYTPEEILYLIDLAADLKSKKKQGILHDSLIGKNIALIFEKTSTRTPAKKRAFLTPRVCWDACLTVSSTADTDRTSWRNWQNMQGFQCGMV